MIVFCLLEWIIWTKIRKSSIKVDLLATVGSSSYVFVMIAITSLCFLQQRGSSTERINTKLGSKFNEKDMKRTMKITLLCTNANPTLRPSMLEVVSMLEEQSNIIPKVILDPNIVVM